MADFTKGYEASSMESATKSGQTEDEYLAPGCRAQQLKTFWKKTGQEYPESGGDET